MAMKPYADPDRNSGILAVDYGPGWVHVKFKTGWIYEYTDGSTGSQHIAEMQRLASIGNGLNAYINLHVGSRFHRKFR